MSDQIIINPALAYEGAHFIDEDRLMLTVPDIDLSVINLPYKNVYKSQVPKRPRDKVEAERALAEVSQKLMKEYLTLVRPMIVME